MTNLAEKLASSVSRDPERIALRMDEFEMPYGALDAASARVAGLLREHGLRAGDRVGVMLPNVPYFAVVYYGVLRAGGTVVPMNVLLKERETSFYLTDSGARAIFAWHEFEAPARAGAETAGADLFEVRPGGFEELLAGATPDSAVVARAADDTAVVLYTSGTTGTPKGAELTHANLGRNVEIVAQMLEVVPDDVILGALPLFHAFGQTCGLNAALAAGAQLTLIPRFDPVKALEILERDRVTIFEGVPTMFSAMLHSEQAEAVDASTLRYCVSGGAAMPVEVMRAFEARFGCGVLEGYGLSETSPAATFNHPDRPRKAGSIGTPIEGVQLRVADEAGNEVVPGDAGEILIRGHNVMKGYWRRPEATAEAIDGDGWFHTGDIGRVDEDGYFFIVDRKKDMIIRGGYNVYPREIEEVLHEHPAVREAAVVGVTHAELGEEVAAAVALKPGRRAEPGELREFVKSRVAAYKYPRRVWIVDELPKGPTGKILKREIEAPPE
jgi:long-chain acyl-CoA synthetase